MFISITFTETSIDETNKTQQKVRVSKFMFKMSTIHANTCIQTTTQLHNRWWFWWQCPVLVLYTQLHFLEPGVKVNGDYYRNTVLLNMLLLDIRSVFGDYYVFQQDCQDGASAHRACDTVMLQRETPEFTFQRCGHLIRQVWIRWTTASGVCFKRGSTACRSMMWMSWKNVCWGSGCCYMHTVIAAAIAQWHSRLNACVRVNGGHFEHKFWASDFLLCFVCFIDTGFRKYDRYKHVQSANIVWNVLLLCLRLSHGMVAT